MTSNGNRLRILFIFPNIDSPGYKPVSISTLCAIIKSKEHEVLLYDTSFFETSSYNSNSDFVPNNEVGEEISNFIPVDEEKYGLEKTSVELDKDFTKVLQEFKPDLILVSTLSQEFGLSVYLLRIAKEYDKDILTLMGGRHCYSDPDDALSESSIDMICIGEGEKPLSELIECLSEKRDYTRIQGLWVKREGKVYRNKLNSYFKDLDTLPYLDLSIYDERQFYRIFMGKIYRSVDYVWKRGCFEKCGYCQSEIVQEWHQGDRSMRAYSVERAIEELEFLKEKHQLEFVRFHDETFLAVPAKVLESFAQQYQERVNLPFVVDAAPQTVSKIKVELLKEAGCQSISLGCESGNEEFRYKVLNKRVDNKTVTKAFHMINEQNIRTVMFVLIGFPFERREYIEDTIKLCRNANVASPNIGFFYPFKGSKLRGVAEKNGWFDPNIEVNGTAQYGRNRPLVSNPNITPEEYLGIFRTFLFYCKLPEEMFDEIREAETDENAYKRVRDLYLSLNRIK